MGPAGAGRFGQGGGGEFLVERGERRVETAGKFEIGGVVYRQLMAPGEKQERRLIRRPVQDHGRLQNPREKRNGIPWLDAPTPFPDNQSVTQLKPPQGRRARFAIWQDAKRV